MAYEADSGNRPRHVDITASSHTSHPDRKDGYRAALSEVTSKHIFGGPHGVSVSYKASTLSIPYDLMSIVSTSNVERTLLRRKTLEGEDIPVDFDDAIEETGFGRFHYQLMALCGLIYACCSLSTTTLSFVLPAAQHDFKLSSVDKGILNTAPLLGMVLGSYIWGNFADSKGRKFVLFCSLVTDALAAFFSSLSQQYTLFFIFRIFNGFGIIGATSMVFAYFGEFLDPMRRDKKLACLELFWNIGIVSLPIIGFGILTHHWSIGGEGYFVFNSWRLFVFVCGLPSLIAAIIITQFPESPRFLLLQGKLDKAKSVLERMYVMNHKNCAEVFPVKVLSESKEAQNYYFPNLDNASRWKIIKERFRGIIHQHKNLFTDQSLKNILVTCYIDFGLMSSYYTIMLWIPELLERLDRFQKENPGVRATLCEVSEHMPKVEDTKVIDTKVFIHTFIICLACIPTTLVLLFLIQYVSKKILLVVILCGAGISAMVMYFVNTTVQVIAMCCIFESLTTLVEAILFCVIVQIFPTNTRGTALSLTVTIGRVGSVLGNIMFGSLIDIYCVVPFIVFTVALITSGLMSLLLPKMNIGH